MLRKGLFELLNLLLMGVWPEEIEINRGTGERDFIESGEGFGNFFFLSVGFRGSWFFGKGWFGVGVFFFLGAGGPALVGRLFRKEGGVKFPVEIWGNFKGLTKPTFRTEFSIFKAPLSECRAQLTLETYI